MIGLPPKMAGFDVIRRRMSVSLRVLATTHLPIMLPQFQASGQLAVFETLSLPWRERQRNSATPVGASQCPRARVQARTS